MCLCADLKLDNLHARAEMRVSLPSGAGTAKEMAAPIQGICMATSDKCSPELERQ